METSYGKENWCNLEILVKHHYEERKSIIQKFEDELNCKIYCYEIHDGKMLYLLTQHSLYSRLYSPYVLCSCTRGDYCKVKK